MTNEGLMIKNAQVEDEGIYYCQASVTATGEVKRIEINVQVMSKPRIKNSALSILTVCLAFLRE